MLPNAPLATSRTLSQAGVSNVHVIVTSVKTISTTVSIARPTASSPRASATKKPKRTLSPSSTLTGNPSPSHTQILDSTMASPLALGLLLMATFKLAKTRLSTPSGQTPTTRL